MKGGVYGLRRKEEAERREEGKVNAEAFSTRAMRAALMIVDNKIKKERKRGK